MFKDKSKESFVKAHMGTHRSCHSPSIYKLSCCEIFIKFLKNIYISHTHQLYICDHLTLNISMYRVNNQYINV